MAEEVSIGDTVKVKSGGPTMTVSAIQEEDGEKVAVCQWFDKQVQGKGKFPIAVLVKFSPASIAGGFYVGGVRRG